MFYQHNKTNPHNVKLKKVRELKNFANQTLFYCHGYNVAGGSRNKNFDDYYKEIELKQFKQ